MAAAKRRVFTEKAFLQESRDMVGVVRVAVQVLIFMAVNSMGTVRAYMQKHSELQRPAMPVCLMGKYMPPVCTNPVTAT
jgi:hypothetical protein